MFQLYFDLGESIPNMTDWIQAIAALGVLGLTALMVHYARQALNTWKHQKKLDIVSEGKANMLLCIELFVKITNFEELAYQGTRSFHTEAYQNGYKPFFIKDFMEKSDSIMIGSVVVYYDVFKANHIMDFQTIIYNASKITTYNDDISYLAFELEQIKTFYNKLISLLDQFSFSFDMLKKELYDQDKTEEENIWIFWSKLTPVIWTNKKSPSAFRGC